MTTINDWLKNSTTLLKNSGIENSRLDCLVLLEEVLNKDRSNIIAHADEDLSLKQKNKLDKLVTNRLKRLPLAYILNRKEFYGREFFVNKDVLIPRPSSEDIIDLVNKLPINSNFKIADIGTGSGILAITLAKQYPLVSFSAYDNSKKALKVAKLNAKKHHADINLGRSDLLESINGPFNIIVANLPYVNSNKMVAKEIEYEPHEAIFSEENGLFLIKKLIEQVSEKILIPGGWLILESDIDQHSTIKKMAKSNNLKFIESINLIQLFQFSPLN